jgi:ubiquinone/menaquinone biosynthesis C-methylase UbiE
MMSLLNGVTNFVGNSLALSLGALAGNQTTLRVACWQMPRPMPHQLAAVLDHPLRMRYRHPAEELGLYGCGVGLHVLDLGCGTGTYTIEMARLVSDSGRVYAVDLQEPLVAQTRQRVMAAGLAERVRVHCSGAYQLPLEDDSIDLAVLVATLPQIPNKLLALAELSRVLKPQGRLVISEELPDPAYVPPPVTRRWLTEAGFQFGGQSGSWFCYHLICFNQK